MIILIVFIIVWGFNKEIDKVNKICFLVDIGFIFLIFEGFFVYKDYVIYIKNKNLMM